MPRTAEAQRAYRKTPEGKAAMRRYRRTAKRKRKQGAELAAAIAAPAMLAEAQAALDRSAKEMEAR